MIKANQIILSIYLGILVMIPDSSRIILKNAQDWNTKEVFSMYLNKRDSYMVLHYKIYIIVIFLKCCM